MLCPMLFALWSKRRPHDNNDHDRNNNNSATAIVCVCFSPIVDFVLRGRQVPEGKTAPPLARWHVMICLRVALRGCRCHPRVWHNGAWYEAACGLFTREVWNFNVWIETRVSPRCFWAPFRFRTGGVARVLWTWSSKPPARVSVFHDLFL